MQAKETKSNDFLNKLNAMIENDFKIKFGYHEPKEGIALAYFYTYLDTEGRAKDIAAWLTHKGIESEIFYMPRKKQYLVKIPFANTFHHDYLDLHELQKPVVTMLEMLSNACLKVDTTWIANYGQLAALLRSLDEEMSKSRKIRRTDLVQTSLFVLKVNYAGSDLIDAAVRPETDLSFLIPQVENIIRNLTSFNEEFRKTRTTLNQKISKSTMNANETWLAFSKHWVSLINRFFNIVTTNIDTFSKVCRIDNHLYNQWLFINKQLKLVETQPKFQGFKDRWLALKSLCISAASKSREKLDKSPLGFYQENTAQYMAQFLNFDYMTPGTEQYDAIAAEKMRAEKTITQNREDIQALEKLYQTLKKDVSDLAKEMFLSQNIQTPKMSDTTNPESDSSQTSTLKV